MTIDPNAARRAEIERYIVDSNLDGEPSVSESPSGRYRLVIRSYRTIPGRWNYSRGTIVRVVDGQTVCDLVRNLGAFHHSFVTKDGREYLITGRSYTSQTIVDLDLGREYEPPGDHYADRFCWAQCSLSPDGTTLAVDGCVWAAPYQYLFFDFTDPARGWPQLTIAGDVSVENPSDRRAPEWIDGTTIDCFQSDADGAPLERTRLVRRGDQMVITEHWVEDAERARREASARANAEDDAWWEQFHTTDPMYLRLAERVRELQIPCEWYNWRRATGRRISIQCRRVSPPAAADLSWDPGSRTLRLRLHTPDRVLTFDHTLAGMEACIAALDAALRTSN